MALDQDTIEQTEQLLRQVGVFLGEPALTDLGLGAEVGALRKAVTEKLTLLRASLRGLKDLKKRDPFEKDPTLATERHKYNRDIARVETDCELELTLRVRQLHGTLKEMPEGKTLAGELGKILGEARKEAEKSRIIPPEREEYVRRDPDVYIAQKIHWDRDLVTETFIGMIRNDPKHPWRVLGIQGPKDAHIDSLVTRFEEMCKGATTPRPLLYAKVSLRRGFRSIHDLASKTLERLSAFAADAEQEILRSQEGILMQACKAIERRSFGEPGLGGQRMSPSPYQVARDLTNCFRQVSQHCTVVLLLQHFEQVCNSEAGKWLRDEWLISRACRVPGLVIVITGETGLEELAGLESEGIFCFDSLPRMTWQDFADWARKGYGFRWFTDQRARQMHSRMHGSTMEFARYLELKEMEVELGLITKDILANQQ